LLMRRYHFLGAFFGLLILLSGAPLAEAQKKKKDDLDPKEGKTSEKMIKAGQLVGKVKNVYESKKTLRISVTVVTSKPNVGAIQGLAQAKQNYLNAIYKRPPDRAGALQALAQMQQHQANLLTYEKKDHEIELSTVDEVEVRAAKPKPEFDEKGNVKRLTKKELKELKGDPKKPGYKAEFGDVQPDQIIKVQLVKKKGEPKPAPMRRKKDEEIDPLADNLPVVSSIMIVHDPAWLPAPKIKAPRER